MVDVACIVGRQEYIGLVSVAWDATDNHSSAPIYVRQWDIVV